MNQYNHQFSLINYIKYFKFLFFVIKLFIIILKLLINNQKYFDFFNFNTNINIKRINYFIVIIFIFQ